MTHITELFKELYEQKKLGDDSVPNNEWASREAALVGRYTGLKPDKILEFGRRCALGCPFTRHSHRDHIPPQKDFCEDMTDTARWMAQFDLMGGTRSLVAALEALPKTKPQKPKPDD